MVGFIFYFLETILKKCTGAAQWSSLMGYITNIYALLGYKVALIKLDIYGGSLKKGKLFLNNVSQNKKPKNKQNSGSKTHAAIIAVGDRTHDRPYASKISSSTTMSLGPETLII